MSSEIHGTMRAIRVLSLWLASIGIATAVQAQGGGGTGGGGTGGGATGGTGGFGGNTAASTGGQASSTAGNNTGSQATGSTTSASSGSAGLGQQTADLVPKIEFADIGNKPFVGVTGAMLQELGFVGANSASLGGADSTVFGGGVNNASGGGGGAGGGAARAGAGGNRALGGMGGMAGGNGLVTDVFRGGIRARLVNSIGTVRPDSTAVAERFQARLAQIPVLRDGGPTGISIAVSSGTATLTGTATSAEAASRIVRQLQLEPGIYRIENRIVVPGGL